MKEQFFGVAAGIMLSVTPIMADQVEIEGDYQYHNPYTIYEHVGCHIKHVVVTESIDHLYINGELVGKLDSSGQIGVMVGSSIGIQLFNPADHTFEATRWYLDLILKEHKFPAYDQLATFECFYS